MGNLLDIQMQIEKLQKQASDIKDREFDKTVQEIRDTMKAFGITIKDLQAKAPAKRKRSGKVTVAGKPKAAKTNKTAGTIVAAKYRGPNGETWSGRGLTPRWLSALLEQGKSKQDFAI